ncbi:hypothetical protein UFOVP510_40 [uncultured Caudovirales phage]|uniref:Uncharacterized protein n=1 Tax=uncultured Caudovirales phage TaxID=2100421 RepID=A0A6J5MLF7_9CAUD|nr:hypothetical protein UFOVP510_40 [uncultured Caudovirales phage]
MDKRFATAFLPLRTRKVLGRTLQPFSIRHRMILEAMESPFVTPGKEFIKPKDLIIAAIVLSGRSVDECLKEPTIGDILRSWLLHRSREYFEYCLTGIKVHLEEGASYPLLFKKEGSSGSVGSRGLDWRALLIGSLVKHGVSVEEVLTMPESQVVWLYTAIAISEGVEVDILPTDQEEELEKQPTR